MDELDISKTALVVIDLQKGIVGRETFPHAARSVVENAVLLAQAFRKNNLPVFLIRVTSSEDGKDALTPIADISMTSFTRAVDWAEIVPELGPEVTDFVITKRQWGAFYGTDLDLQLRRRGVKTIVLCGISTNIGVESTARFAYEYGYDQIFAEDAMTALSEGEHAASVEKIFPRMGQVKNTSQILTAY